MKPRRVRAAALTLVILIILAFKGNILAQSDKAYLQLTDEQKETLDDALSTSKNMATESQEKLTEMLNHWNILKDNFQSLPPELQDAINKVEKDGFTAKVNYTLGKLKQFEGGLKEVMDVKEDLEKAVNFYERYAPDAENPFRSLEVMSNFFKDVEKLLPKEDKYEAIKSPVTFMIRTGINYFRDGIDLALGGLKNIQKQIRDRAGNCIGYVGGDGTADSSDPRRKAFTDIGTGDVICYTGVRPIGGEIWCDETGNGVYIWSSGRWTLLQAAFGLVTDIFTNWRLANESVIPADEMIRWCNSYQRLYIESRDWGQKEFGRLAAMNNCREDLLEKRNRYGDWMKLMESVQTDRQLFVAKYIFNKDGIREAAKTLTDIMYDQVLFQGVIEDQEGTRVSGAAVTISTPAGTRSDQTVNGRYTIIMDYPEADRNNSPIEITVTASGYSDLKETSVLYTQCMDLGLLLLDKVVQDEQPDTSCGPNEYYDPVAQVCICNVGYVRNAQGICVEDADDEPGIPDCPDPNAEPVWNNSTGVYDCLCKDYFIPDPVTGLCKPDVQQILNDSDCSQWPNTHPVWDYSRNEVYCDCLPGYSWRPDNLGCEETGKLLASQADCSGYPNTQPVWDDVNKTVICDCLPGYVWDENFTQCYPQSVAQLNSINCAALPNTMPVWDPVRQEPYCDCLPGYKWRDDLSGCDQITATQIMHADCSHIPNSHQVYDPASDMMYCDCLPGFVWNSSLTACEPERKRPAIDMNTLMNFMTVLSGAMNNNMPGAIPPGNMPPNQQPPVVHQSRCNDTQKAGGDAPEVHQIDLGMTSGVFRFDYQTFDVKDQIIITQGGMTIFNTGCVGENRSVQVQFNGYTTMIEVRVNPNCAGSSGTAWNFTVHCPGY
ncbi:MAG: carboxypeptidase-like regulatory domain-containing protein [Bacteroidales bacterium]